MTTNRREFIKTLVARAKVEASDHVPAANPHFIDIMVERIPLEIFPPKLWLEAVDHWADNVQEGLLKPKDLMRAAYAIRDRWEAQPEKREVLNQLRQARLDQRVRRGELPPGTTPAKALESTANQDPRTKDQIKKDFFAELARRRAEREAENPTQSTTPDEALQALQKLVDQHTKGEEKP